jgi:hypothetical protein
MREEAFRGTQGAGPLLQNDKAQSLRETMDLPHAEHIAGGGNTNAPRPRAVARVKTPASFG